MLSRSPQVDLCTRKSSNEFIRFLHAGGFELTKLTYIRLEDNLIRHWGDRHKKRDELCDHQPRDMRHTSLYIQQDGSDMQG